MSKDVKVDVLYYKSTTDISLEFGLYGKYPIRLLSSDCQDINSFFQNLKRAVSRSEIVITVGGFDEEDNLPMFIARAVGLNCEIPDLLKQNIIADKDYCLPKGAIALAPKSRRFGGFLLECGPQAIISLTDERKVRQDIVEEFLANYITEHHKVFSTPNAKKSVVDTENQDVQSTETEEPIIETHLEEITDVSPETDKDIIPETTETEITPEIELGEVSEPDAENTEASTTSDLDENSVDHVLNDEDYDVIADRVKKLTLADEVKNFIDDIDDIDDVQPQNEKSETFDRHLTRRRKRLIRAICLVLSLLIILGTFFGYWISTVRPQTFDIAEYYKSLHSVYYSYQNDNLADAFDLVKSKNSNFFTWLCFEDVYIDHPVLTVSQTVDPQRYLTALPDGNPDKNGTVFSTANSSLNNVEHNAVIFGNALDGGIFSSIKNSLSKTLVGKHISTADNRFYSEWTVFSVFSKERTADFDNTQTTFESNEEYVEYLNNIKDSSNKNNKSLDTFRGNEKVIVLVGVADNVDYCVAAKLVSVKALYGSNTDLDDTSSNTTSSDNSSSDTTSNPEDNVPDSELDHTGNDFMGDTPDIVVPLPPTTSSSTPSSSVVSSATSSLVSSSENPSSSTPTSTETGSSTTTETSSVTSTPSSTESTSSEPSTTTPSTTPSSEASSVISSEASSSVTSSTVRPDVEPIYTWDIELSCIDSATGVKYTDTAVKIVAMIIEDEMSPTIDPPEALIAQAIVKYNWLLNNNGRNPNKAPKNALDPNPTKQAIEYATAAKGKLLLYGNTIAKTYCYAYSAGKTANYQDIWGGDAPPYLQSVDCPVDEELKDFITSKTYAAEDIKKLISDKCGIDVSAMPKHEWIKAVKYDNNNLYCVTVSIGGKEYKGTYLRDSLLSYGIRSSAYTIAYNETDDTFTFTCKGYGHGVGFSQRGAKAYAKQGWDHAQILAHFFPGTTLISY